MRFTLALALVVAVGAATGCTSTEAGSPTTALTTTTPAGSRDPEPPTSSSGSREELPFAGAPKVDNPLDVDRFVSKPCLALTAEQATTLGVKPQGEARKGPTGELCDWTNEVGALIDFGFTVTDSRGLSAIYAAKDKYKYFERLPDVEGYPVVAADVVSRRDKGSCVVSVGVSDELAFTLGLVQSPEKIGSADPCTVAASVSTMMLKTMKSGG